MAANSDLPAVTTEDTGQLPQPGIKYPRIVIHYCIGCRWLLRAAWVAQELLTTFTTSLGEVSMAPTVGGVFRVEMLHTPSPTPTDNDDQAGSAPLLEVNVLRSLLWERTKETGFPEVKVLKNRIRDIIDPSRSLGHSDTRVNIPASTAKGYIPTPQQTSQAEVVDAGPSCPIE